MQQKVQKSSSTILPRRSARVSGDPPVFSQPRPRSSGARTRIRVGIYFVGLRQSTCSALPFSWSTTYGWPWSGHCVGEPTLDTIWNAPAVEQLVLSALSPDFFTQELTAKLLALV